MTLPQLKEALRACIRDDRTGAFFTLWREHVWEDASVSGSIDVQAGAWERLQRKVQRGELDFREQETATNRIHGQLTDCIEALGTYDLRQPGQTDNDRARARRQRAEQYELEALPTASRLLDYLETIQVDDPNIGLLNRVNCSREEETNFFFEQFERYLDRSQHYQVYLISAADTQLGQRFAERMLYELIQEELDEEEGAIFYRNRPDGRLRLDDLPVGRSLRRSKAEFSKYIAGVFELRGKEDVPGFFSSGIAGYRHEFILLAFRVLESKWQPWLPEYYEWIIEQCRLLTTDGPRLILSIVHFATDAHLPDRQSPRSRTITDALDRLDRELDLARHIARLPAVPENDFFDWFRNVGLENPTLLRTALTIILDGLSPETRSQYDTNKKLDMADLDVAIEIIYNHLNR